MVHFFRLNSLNDPRRPYQKSVHIGHSWHLQRSPDARLADKLPIGTKRELGIGE